MEQFEISKIRLKKSVQIVSSDDLQVLKDAATSLPKKALNNATIITGKKATGVVAVEQGRTDIIGAGKEGLNAA